ncbi:tRNA pseudouridine(38-40) synthase TruA [Sulfurovum sp. zt1-1]|uniref:tRNA pseudouridine synthase A n=1 Tax=Sulfurovum zhangzhouensis TaxID=3019067 RepID=A0ABT7QWK0_9BACT|nr:tRNA pseudouridine(38-40) synthase TruA [Sulfurovum zhangzhouensis]MDM5271162.1 tRNA pseudouridine(38-40) synthase TruA [Sulfurovum zhangzhouensis]
MRVKAVITYDGSAFFGFQRQKSTKETVTSDIEHALKSLKIDSEITGSGRTDRGVHATGQVIHFDLPSYWNNLEKLKLSLNRKLNAIAIKHIAKVDDDFHARFSAKKRLYRYVFKTQPPSVFEKNYISYYDQFDKTVLQKALNCFIGQHDFKYFHKTGSDTHTTVRTIYQAKYREKDNYHFIYFEANGFLRSQVRMMIESAMQCAKGEMQLSQLQEQLAGIKKYNHRLAPPEGLYLARILY